MTNDREERVVVVVVSEQTARALSCGYVSLAAMDAARDALDRPEGERPFKAWRCPDTSVHADHPLTCTRVGKHDPVWVVPVKEGK